MRRLAHIKGFEWDKGNKDKSYEKHGVTIHEAESVFLDTRMIVKEDITHPQEENRLIVIGESTSEKTLFITFTFRDENVRIISARLANKKERSLYEKAQKHTKV